ncbi:MAG TPA: flagellar basal body P-ring protein FlgI [Steroidobacteraceae bacterium]|jgi:flagellar P-ring protein precursor FlgI|nr:flagellar basal body P-ring protein FlgI [Steroidobacteraceae bacterium]
MTSRIFTSRVLTSRIFAKAFLAALFAFLAVPQAQAERIKDMAQIQGVRTNQLVGYGLVVGLDSTGDQTSQAPFTVQSLNNMLAQLGITVPANVTPQLKNVAAVAVHAVLPPFVKPGQTIDITVNSIANAKSLRGGSLLVTPLHGLDGQIYAIAQGNLIVSGFGVEGTDGSKLTVNVPSSGRIPNGATVERAVASQIAQGDSVTFNLNDPDFTTATRLVASVNQGMGDGVASVMDGGSIRVRAPIDITQRVAFLSMVENLEVEPGAAAAKVIINSRTGTVVISSHVIVTPAAVSHGSLSVTIKEEQTVSQPNPFSKLGTTVVLNNSTIKVDQGSNRMFLFKPGVELDQIVRAVNDVGAAPGDLVAILEALREAGALQAELVVI